MQGHNTAEVGIEPPTSRSGVWHSTTEPPHSPNLLKFIFALLSTVFQLYGPRQANLVLLAYASSEGSGEPAQSRQNLRCSLIQAVKSRGTSRQKARSIAPLNGWACAVKICHDGMLEDTNSLDGAHIRQAECARGLTITENYQDWDIYQPRIHHWAT